jgi:hypothetical protein
MTSGQKVLTGELFISLIAVSWFSIKFKYVPWPANYAKVGLAYGVLGILSMASDKLAALFGAGFLTAIFVREASKTKYLRMWEQPNVPGANLSQGEWSPAPGGGFPYYPLFFGAGSGSAQSTTPPSGPTTTPSPAPSPNGPSGGTGNPPVSPTRPNPRVQ